MGLKDLGLPLRRGCWGAVRAFKVFGVRVLGFFA